MAESRLQQIANNDYRVASPSFNEIDQDNSTEERNLYIDTELAVAGILRAKGVTKISKRETSVQRDSAKFGGELRHEAFYVSKPIDMHVRTPEGEKLLGRVSMHKRMVRNGDHFWNRFHALEPSTWLGVRLFSYYEDMSMNTKFHVSAVPLGDEGVLTHAYKGISHYLTELQTMQELATTVEEIREAL